MLNKTSISNLKYIAIVIGILMLLPLFNRLKDGASSEEYRGRGPRGTRRRRRGNKERTSIKLAGTGVNESDYSKARRKAKKCKYLSNPKARERAGC